MQLHIRKINYAKPLLISAKVSTKTVVKKKIIVVVTVFKKSILL